jgi:exopolysaccharide production protein ExoY
VYPVALPREQAPHPFVVQLAERMTAALMLALLLPVLLVIALTIYFLSGRAPLVADRRVGRHGRAFWMLKLRTMWPRDGFARQRFCWIEYLVGELPRALKTANDPRVSNAFAAFCRKHSIDELPQLWHVIQGGMSYVGPRPLTAGELEEHYGDDAFEVLSAKPGLSGLWQVAGRSHLTYRQRKRLDLRLVRHASLGLYVAILRRTLVGVVRGRSAW